MFCLPAAPIRRLAAAWTILAVLLAAPLAQADTFELSVQGRLTAAGGGPVADGVYAMAIGLFPQPQGGVASFKDLFIAVPVKDGLFALA